MIIIKKKKKKIVWLEAWIVLLRSVCKNNIGNWLLNLVQIPQPYPYLQTMSVAVVNLHVDIDGKVRLVRLRNFVLCLFVYKETNGQTSNFHLQDEQTGNGLGKITWASVFRL